MILSKDSILKANDLKTEEIKVPEWGAGGTVIVSTLTSKDRDEYESLMFDRDESKSAGSIRSWLAVRAIRTEDGRRMFTDEEAALLDEKSGVATTRIYEAAQRLNRITDADIEDLAKN